MWKNMIQLDRPQMTIQYDAEEIKEYRHSHNVQYLIACNNSYAKVPCCNVIYTLLVLLYIYIYIYRVYTKEWCGFKS